MPLAKNCQCSLSANRSLQDASKTSSNCLATTNNCPAHPAIGRLKAIQLYFLPPNTTAVTQPMDEGVIPSLKVKYRSRLIKLIIKAIDSNKDIPKINVLDAMKLLTLSWEDVTENTVQNCFARARI